MDANMNVPKRIHQFYFPKFPIYEDPELKLKISHAEKEVEKKNEARYKIEKAIHLKEVERSKLITQLKPLLLQEKQYHEDLKQKWKEKETLQEDIAKLHGSSNARQDGGVCLCSSVEDLNDLIRSLHYRMQHESHTVAEEKLVLGEIKQLEGTRKKVVAMAERRAKIQAKCGQNDYHRNRFLHEPMDVDLDRMRKRKHALAIKIKFMEEQCKAIEKEIRSFEKDLTLVNKKRDEAYEGLVELIKHSDEKDACLCENCLLLRDALQLAAQKDTTTLEELSHAEVEKFMSRWNSDKAFRDDYVSRNFPSLENRQLGRDGRTSNPSKEPVPLTGIPK